MRLVIGAENRQIPGWTHHDIQPLPGIAIVCDYWELPDHIKAGECEEIQITHVLEHFPIEKTHDTFMMLNYLLRSGGTVYIEVPNFKWHAQQILRDPRNRKIVEYAYGGQRNEWDYHYMGFTPEILAEELLDADFKLLELNDNSSIECRAEKL